MFLHWYFPAAKDELILKSIMLQAKADLQVLSIWDLLLSWGPVDEEWSTAMPGIVLGANLKLQVADNLGVRSTI